MEKRSRFALMGAAIVRREEERADSEDAADFEDATEKGNSMRALFGIFPLLVIPVALYNLLALGFGGSVETVNAAGELVRSDVAPILSVLNSDALALPMISQVRWVLTNGDAIILIAMVLLFLEILKSTSTGTATIMNHGVSMVLFIVCLVEFLLLPNFATSTFFILMAMTLLDVLAGVIVTIVSARRDFGVGDV